MSIRFITLKHRIAAKKWYYTDGTIYNNANEGIIKREHRQYRSYSPERYDSVLEYSDDIYVYYAINGEKDEKYESDYDFTANTVI